MDKCCPDGCGIWDQNLRKAFTRCSEQDKTLYGRKYSEMWENSSEFCFELDSIFLNIKTKQLQSDEFKFCSLSLEFLWQMMKQMTSIYLGLFIKLTSRTWFQKMYKTVLHLKLLKSLASPINKLFMTNLTWARMMYFVFQNFTEEYYLEVNPRYRSEVITMVCMVLNCYKRMSSCHHIKRIWFLLN